MNAFILLIASLLFLISLAIYVASRKQLNHLQQLIHGQNHQQHLNQELSALSAGSRGLGERFLKLEKDMRLLRDELDQMKNQQQAASPYGYAIELAQKGYDEERIAELCHISPTEARLLVTIHHTQQQAA